MPAATSVQPDLNAVQELAGFIQSGERGELDGLVCPRCLRQELKVIWVKETASFFCRQCRFERAGRFPRDKKLIARLVTAFSG